MLPQVTLVRRLYETWYDTDFVVYAQGEIVKDGYVAGVDWLEVLTGKGRISFKEAVTTENTETAATLTQAVKLFTSPEHVIREGSKVKLTYRGREAMFICASPPRMYDTHQEIALKREERA